MKDLLDICSALKDLGGESCALATIIQVEGSAYRRPGARMLITPEGRSWGMISGGCLEHDVLHQARGCLQADQPRIVRYDSTSEDDVVFGTGLGCNGVVDVFIEPVTPQFQESFVGVVENCRHSRQSGAIATVVRGPATSSPNRHAFYGQNRWAALDVFQPILENSTLPGEGPVLLSNEVLGGDAHIFVQPLLPPVQLVDFGGWLDVLPLVRIAQNVGFQVLVVDARQRSSSLHFFRDADAIFLCPPAEALKRIKIDARTVAVVMNHHLESDQEALSSLSHLSLPFVGSLGPKRRQQRLLEAMRADGVDVSDEFIRRWHGPVGLDLGADTPEEIGLSIVSEILSVMNGRDAEPIRHRTAPIHKSTPAPAYA